MLRPSEFGNLPRAVLLLAATSFLADVSSEMLYPVLPLFLTQQLAAPATVVGIVEGVAEATQNVVQSVSGWLADRLQRNKPVALVGYGLAALAKPAIGLAQVWPAVLAGRFADRLGTGIRSAPRDALLAGSVDERRRGAAFGFEGLGDNLGAVVGPLLAAGLLFALRVDVHWIFFLALVPGLLAVLVVALVPETRRDQPTDRPPRPNLAALPVRYWKYLLAVAAFGIGNSSNAFIILKAANVGIPNELTIVVYAGFNLVAAAASYPAGALSDRLGRRNVFLVGLAIFALAYAGFAVTGQASVVVGLFVLYGVYQGIFRAVGKAIAADLAPSHLRATGIGLYSTAVGLSALVASLVGGQLWTAAGPAATFLYGAAMAVVGGLLLLALVPARLRPA